MSVSIALEEAVQPQLVADPLTHYAHNGDPQAFTALVQEHQSMVLSTCRAVLGWGPDAEDATQETFIKLARYAGSIQRHPGAWLHAVARTTALDILAKRQRERRLGGELLDDQAVQSAPVEEDADGKRILHESVQDLPPADREVVLAYYWQGRTQDEIALRSGVSQVAVKKRLDRILDHLGRRLRSRGLGAAALALLLGRMQAEEFPVSMAERLAALDPKQLWQPASKPLLGLAGIKAAALVLALAGIGIVGWQLAAPGPQVAAPVASVVTAAPAPAPPPVSPTDAFPAPPARTEVIPTGLPGAWKATDGLVVVTGEASGPQGDPVPVLRLESEGFDPRVLAVEVSDLPPSFVLEYDYRLEEVWCPFAGLTPGIRSDQAAQRLAKPLSSPDPEKLATTRSAGVWHRLRMEVVRDPALGQMRIASSFAGIDAGSWMIPSLVLEPRIPLRVMNCRVVLANWRITPITTKL